MSNTNRRFFTTTVALFLTSVILFYGCSSSGNILTLEPPKNFDACTYHNPKDYGQPINIKKPLKNIDADNKTFIPASVEGGFEKARESISKNTPDEVRINRIEGQVILKAYINENGELTNLNIVESPAKALTKITWETMKTWSFNAATLDGEPIKSMINIPVEYKFYGVMQIRTIQH